MRASFMWGLAGVIALASVPFGSSPAQAAPPSNDDRSFPEYFEEPPFAVDVDLGAATLDGSASACGAPAGADTWWQVPLVPAPVAVTAVAASGDVDPIVEVYDGDTLVDCNDDVDPATLDARVTASAYQIVRVASAQGTVGRVTVRVTRALGAGAIAGVVTDDTSGAPIAGVCVQAVSSDFGDFATGLTSPTGAYRLENVPAADYRVQFSDCDFTRDRYITEFWDDATGLADADPVTVADGATARADAGLARGGVISGVVTDAVDGSPLAGICVAMGNDDRIGGFSTTNMTGAYRVSGLVAGSYAIEYRDCDEGRPAAYATQWHQGAATRGAATRVAVAAGATTTVDEALQLGGTIAGTVRGTGAAAVQGSVAAYTPTGEFVTSTVLSPTGAYRLRGLAGGSYRVRFSGSLVGGPFATEWWNDRPSLAASDPVSVTDGGVTGGIDAVLGGATVLGAVTTTDAEPAAGVCVALGSLVGVTSPTGGYRIGDVPGGSYSLVVDDCAGGPDRYVGTTVPAVAVGAGQTLVRDAVLEARTCAGLLPTIVGTAGDDRLRGTPGRDVIAGLGGDDNIDGAGGDDVICGGSGDDVVRGGAGNDDVYGGSGDDDVYGGSGDDRIDGGLGADVLKGDAGGDTMAGGAGDDTLLGGSGYDTLDGGAGADRCATQQHGGATAFCETP